jgi:hypothetical protein
VAMLGHGGKAIVELTPRSLQWASAAPQATRYETVDLLTMSDEVEGD